VLPYEELLAMRRRLLPEDHPDIAATLVDIADCRKKQGEYGKAVLLYEEALAMRRRLLSDDHPDVGRTTATTGLALRAVGDCAGAVRHLEEALAILSRSLPPNHPELRQVTKAVQSVSEEAAAGGHSPGLGAPVPRASAAAARGLVERVGGEAEGVRGVPGEGPAGAAQEADLARSQQLYSRGVGF
jgi:tetratricopeptide (TPR) repeat protein